MLLTQVALLTLTAYTRFVLVNSHPHLLRHHRYRHQLHASQVDTSDDRQVFLLPSTTTTAEPTTERPQKTLIPSIPRRKRHHRRHVGENHPLSEQNSASHRAQLYAQQLVRTTSQIARKMVRASNTELPDIPGQTEEQRQRLRSDDAHVVADEGGVGMQRWHAARMFAQQNYSAKFAQQLLVLSQILRERSKSDSQPFS